jgi:hypothetical protein
MGDQPLMTKCEAALQQLNVPSAYFKQCAPKPVSKLTFQEPEFLVFYIFLAFEVVFLSLYEAFRRFQNVSQHIFGCKFQMTNHPPFF